MHDGDVKVSHRISDFYLNNNTNWNSLLQRMYPPVPIIARHIKEDLKLASGDYSIPKGTTVVVATYRLHRLDNLYPNPDRFDPDNFLPERQANRHYYAFVPCECFIIPGGG